MCYRSGYTPVLFRICIDIHNQFGSRHLGFPSSTYSWRNPEHCRVVLGPRKYGAGRCNFALLAVEGRAALGYVNYRPSDIDHRFGGRHIGFLGAAGMGIFSPIFSPTIFMKSHQGVSANSKRYKNSSEKIGLG
jgi:hypothetical protein